MYVHDIAFTGNDKVEVAKLKNNLAREFEIKDLGLIKYFLGIENVRSRQGIFFCQRKYVLDLLQDSRLMDCKPCATPIKVDHRLNEDDNEKLIDVGRYQRLVGHHFYLSLTKPDSICGQWD